MEMISAGEREMLKLQRKISMCLSITVVNTGPLCSYHSCSHDFCCLLMGDNYSLPNLFPCHSEISSIANRQQHCSNEE